jgi:hypothetical protein
MSLDDPKVLLSILQIISQGGLALTIFVIWYFDFRRSSKQQEQIQKQTDLALKCANDTTTEAFKKHVALSECLLQLLKDEQEYKSTLTGILDRMEYRLNIPTQCPLAMAGIEKIKSMLEVKQ